jgi:hypothetical protein
MIDLVAFGIIIDDLVFPNGHTVMGVLGGGGPQSAFGMRLPALAGWCDRMNAGLVAGVGHDLPPMAREWLTSAGIDLAGLRVSDLPTARAWQVLEADDGAVPRTRTQVWRVEGRVIGAQLGRSIYHLPMPYQTARGFHLGIHPDEPDLDFIRKLGDGGPPTGADRPGLTAKAGKRPLISIEPFKPADHSLNDDALRQLCSIADVFSPNLVEAQSLVGQAAPDELTRRLAEAGARCVALRMGGEGSLVYEGKSDTLVHVPAIATQVVDTTGAGNAYCGGFLAGYMQTGDGLTAARYGAVAASFLVEQVGLPPVTEQLGAEANRRLAALAGQRGQEAVM